MTPSPHRIGAGRVFSIPPGVPFLPTLANALLDGTLVPGFEPRRDPLALGEATLYLPTRRAARALEEVFLDALGGEAALLPRIAPLGDVDEDLLLLEPPPGEAALAIAEAIDPLERRITLARLVARYAASLEAAVGAALRAEPGEDDPFFLVRSTPAAVLHLADELARLADSLETEEIGWDRLAGLAPEEHGRYWAITLQFLKIAGEIWPRHLAESGRLDPARRRTLLLEAERERLARGAGQGPVIAAGSTGSIPATARLIAAIARLPNGAVVLPGLDTVCEDSAFPDLSDRSAQGFGHPQHGLARLLERLGVARQEVAELGTPSRAADGRRRLAGEALRPAGTTDRWPHRRRAFGDMAAALDGLSLVEAASEHDEALAIALLMRETLEAPGRTAALLTPDRRLARRVAAELKRWKLAVDDSAGRPFAEAPQAVLSELVAEAAGSGLAPEALVALLRHPLARFGLPRAAAAHAADALEIGVLRGPAPAADLAGLEAALALARSDATSGRIPSARRRLSAADWAVAADLLDRIGAALAPLLELRAGPAPLGALAAAQIAAIEAVTADDEGVVGGFEGRGGEMLLARLTALVAQDGDGLAFDLGGWAPALRVLLNDLVAPIPPLGHPRLAILGLPEARLLGFDRVILGGLVEGTWPPIPAADPWLNRAFRGTLGLTPPERRIGLVAHDFTQALGAEEVVLVRALRTGGQPTVPARFLQRLAAFAGEEAWKTVTARGARVLAMARALDEAPPSEAARRLARPPEPRPPRPLRPHKLRVTEIETLLRDPYAIYARHVLGLEPLDGLALQPGAADRGIAVHDAAARLVREALDPTTPDCFDRLCAIGRDCFGALLETPDVAALWWPRFERVARWFLAWEAGRRGGCAESRIELSARLKWLTVAEEVFELTGRADRLDRGPGGGWTILDYKTGALPGRKEPRVGLAPQLPLEGAMLIEGGFAEIGERARLDGLVYVRLNGGDPAGEERVLEFDGKGVEEASLQALASLKRVIDAFENEDMPYRSRTRPKFAARQDGPYDHLARVREWSAGGEDEP